MWSPALVASDVDGTLLDNKEKVTARTRKAVHAVVAGGAHFVVATGRPPRWVHPVVEGLGVAPLCVCANGAVIYDSATDRVLQVQNLDPYRLAKLAEIALRSIPGAGLAVERVGKSAHDAATPQFVSSPGYQHAWLNPDNTEVSITEVLDQPAVKLLIRHPGACSADMVKAIATEVGFLADITFSTNNGLIELSAPGITKASGLQVIVDRLNISPASVLAFGDMPNDIPMLTWAGHGVAMGNAHPEVKAIADEITETNSQDGVASVIERLLV
ncbi:MAG: HAD family hydrolase [Mycobacteriaceae bacterium]